jgi:hypothetical protein
MNFQAGRWYKCTRKSRGPHWNDKGQMDFALSGEPLLCRYGIGSHADFVGHERGKEDDSSYWWWEDDFIECPPEDSSIHEIWNELNME